MQEHIGAIMYMPVEILLCHGEVERLALKAASSNAAAVTLLFLSV